MTPDERLAQIARAAEEGGLPCLAMGGHAVRYYGVDRNTVDFDFCASAPSMQELKARLARIQLLRNLREGPSWRPDDFARFEVGKLPDGREEWLEFWLHNHLLPTYPELQLRAERGVYGGRMVAFMSLPDLLRSKETERESDWRDIALLEEIQDARHFAAASTEPGVIAFLSNLRSRRGLERGLASHFFEDTRRVRAAGERCGHPVSFAFLAPLALDLSPPDSLRMPIEPTYLNAIRAAEFASPKHLALVEIVRRAYKRRAKETDRLDKQSRLKPT